MDFVFDIGRFTRQVTPAFAEIKTPDNASRALWPNSLEVHVQSAKRTSIEAPVSILWDPNAFGDAFDIVIEDGPWTLFGIPWADQPMEPGLMKVSLAGEYTNESPVSFKLAITRGNGREAKRRPVAWEHIEQDDSFFIPVEVPKGARRVSFDLEWHGNWKRFPRNDLDMVILDPQTLTAVSWAGATLNAPERAVLETPLAGTDFVWVGGFEVHRPERFRLFVTIA